MAAAARWLDPAAAGASREVLDPWDDVDKELRNRPPK